MAIEIELSGSSAASTTSASRQQTQPGAILTPHLRIVRNLRKAKVWRIVSKGWRYIYLDDRSWCTSRIRHVNDHRDWPYSGNRWFEGNSMYFNVGAFSDTEGLSSETILEDESCSINGRKNKKQEVESLTNRPVAPESPPFPEPPSSRGFLRLLVGWGFFLFAILCAAHAVNHHTAFGFVRFAACTFISRWLGFTLFLVNCTIVNQVGTLFSGSCRLFAPLREARLLRAIMRTGFQFVVFAGVAVEVDDLLFGFAYFGHPISPRHRWHKPFEAWIVVQSCIVRITDDDAFVRSLNQRIKLASFCLPTFVFVQHHRKRQHVRVFISRLNYDPINLVTSISPPKVNVKST
jgi:hypothetical protein